MMRTLVEYPAFSKQAEALWKEDEYNAFTFWIAQNPEAGDVIPGTRGARKVRWSRAGTGKSGGARVIYYHFAAAEQVVLMAIYAKATRESMSAHEIRKLAE
jgi:hypothetical protein